MASAKPWANEHFGGGFFIQEVKSWREQEHRAGRPSGLKDFYEVHHLCWACKSTGIHLSPIAFDVDVPLFIECPVCGGTGKLIDLPIEPLASPSS